MADNKNLLAGFGALNKTDPNPSPAAAAASTSTSQAPKEAAENGDQAIKDSIEQAHTATNQTAGTDSYDPTRGPLIDPVDALGNMPAPESQYHRDGYKSIVGEAAGVEETRTFFNKKYRRFRVGRFEFRRNYLDLTPKEAEEFLAIVTAPDFPYEEAVQIVEVNRAAAAAAETSILDKVPAGQGVVRGAMSASDILTAKDKQRYAEGLESRIGANGGLLNPTPVSSRTAFQQ